MGAYLSQIQNLKLLTGYKTHGFLSLPLRPDSLNMSLILAPLPLAVHLVS